MKIINLTDHPIRILDNNNNPIRVFKPTKYPARLSTRLSYGGFIDGIQISDCIINETKNLPNEREGIFFIVSNFIKNLFPHRKDLLIPALKIRKDGKEIGCKTLLNKVKRK